MQLASGGNLSTFLRSTAPLDKSLSKLLFAQIVNGVCYMRTKNIAHRDLKLSNLLFTDDTNVVTTDFGLSRIAFREKKGGLIRSITICGTLPYMGPEILLRQPYNAFLVDIWVLGVIVYNLLNADYPFP